MAEIVFSAPDADYLASEAARLGFMDEAGQIIVAGPMRSGGNYFLNIVGTIYEPQPPVEDPPPPVPRDGYWGRLRLNGDIQDAPTFSPLITQYVYSAAFEGWTDDGATLAPEWIADIGLIA